MSEMSYLISRIIHLALKLPHAVLSYFSVISPTCYVETGPSLERQLGGGGAYSYIHVLPDRFLFKLMNLNLI